MTRRAKIPLAREGRLMKRRRLTPESLGSERMLGIFISKWAIKIVHRLAEAPRRHSELLRLLRPILQRVLTHTLRELQEAQLIERNVLSVGPPLVVEYAITKLGRSFIKPLNALYKWAEVHRRNLDLIAERMHVGATEQTLRWMEKTSFPV